MYDDRSSEGGPKGTFEIYRAEGDVLFKQGEYKKALNSYTTALELKPGDKNCLVARSQCQLQLGNPDAALTDAEATLEDDKNFIKGLLQKAEALYQKGDFEYALVFYHRGNKLRSEVKGFRLGIQKCQEAIDNSIGSSARVTLSNEGDLSYFYEADEKKKKQEKKKGGFNNKPLKKDEKKEKKQRANAKDSKTVKQLLGELYNEKEWLEKLLQEMENSDRKTETNTQIKELALAGLQYLDTRTDFWQQQKPMYSRKRDKKMRENTRNQAGSSGQDPTRYVLNNLEKIDDYQAKGSYDDSLKLAKKTLREVEKWSEDDIPNRQEVVANLHSSIGNAYLEKQNYAKSLDHHNRDLEIANQNDLEDAKSRALDNIGRVYARTGKFEKAIEVWEKKLPLSKTDLETTWLCHEIGRCHLECERYDKAKEYGERSLEAADSAGDEVWQMNASVLVAQAQVKLGDNQAALEAFEKSLDLAKLQDDHKAEKAISKAIKDINDKIAKQLKQKGEGAEGRKGRRPSEDSSKQEEEESPADVAAEIRDSNDDDKDAGDIANEIKDDNKDAEVEDADDIAKAIRDANDEEP